jgi:hypothetical protein
VEASVSDRFQKPIFFTYITGTNEVEGEMREACSTNGGEEERQRERDY